MQVPAALTGQALQLADRRGLHLGQLQAEGHVVVDLHVRIERVVLEHHGDVPLLGRDQVHHTSADGDLYYDDNSADPSVADLMSGITTIDPGESVVFVDGSATTGGPNVALWAALWAPDLAALPQIGTYEGSGLGGGGDGVTLFLDTDSNGPSADEQIAVALYPFADDDGGQSWDVTQGVFSGSLVNAVVTTDVNDESQPAVATPGFLGVVPEPGTIALAAMSLIGLLGVRRK